MTYNSLSTLLILGLTTVLASCSSPLQQKQELGEPASIANAPASAAVFQGDGIKVSATPLKQSVELGEPIYLALSITNEKQEPIKIMGGLRPGIGLIKVYAVGENKTKTLLPPFSESDFDNSTTLAPRQTIGDVFPIFFGANGWNFKEAGEYQVFVQLKIPTKGGFSTFNSNTSVIKIKDSKAGESLFAEKKRNRIEAGKFLLWRTGDHLEKGINLLTRISEQYPKSSLSSYIYAAQAQNYSEPFANYLIQKVRPANCLKASELRERVNTDVLTKNLVIEGYISIAKCHAEKQQWRAAKKALNTGFKLSKDNPELKAYSKNIEEMTKRLNQYL